MRNIIKSLGEYVLLLVIFSSVLAQRNFGSPLPTRNHSVNACTFNRGCQALYSIAMWTPEFVTSICSDAGRTDKSTTAVLCRRYADNVKYETSLKLAILNSMYGTSNTLGSGKCHQHCMYDPLNIGGKKAVGFQWSIRNKCWNVIRGARDKLCYKIGNKEWYWAIERARNMCQAPTFKCQLFRGISSWTQEHLRSICKNGGLTDKSTTASLCHPHDGNEEYEFSLKLAILNRMYGSRPDSVRCSNWCMYDPIHVSGDDAIGFQWSNKNKCWKVLVGGRSWLCYKRSRKEWGAAVFKSYIFCRSHTCGVKGNTLQSLHSNDPMRATRLVPGDYSLYHSSKLRVDVRIRPYYTNKGQLLSTIAGVHATAFEVVDGGCKAKLEIYNQYQTSNGELRFLYNGEDVGWTDLEKRSRTCDDICAGMFIADIDKKWVFVKFVGGTSIIVKNVENMHELSMSVTFQRIAYDGVLFKQDQMCMGQIRKLNCTNDETIFQDCNALIGQKQ